MHQQEHNIQILKLIAAMMVITVHVSSYYVVEYRDTPGLLFTVGNLYDSLSRFCVPLFVMISGKFLLSRDGNADGSAFYTHKLRTSVLPLLAWNVFYIVYPIAIDLLGYVIAGSPLDVATPVAVSQRLHAWFMGEPKTHLWYMYMLLGLYLITPWLVRLRLRHGERPLCLMAVGGAVVSVVIGHLAWINWVPAQSLLYLGYYCLGYVLRGFKRASMPRYAWLALAIVSGLAIFGLTELLVRSGTSDRPLYFYTFTNPLVLCGATSLYILFLQVEVSPNNRLLPIAAHTTTIYYAHILVLDVVMNRVLAPSGIEGHPIWFVPGMVLLALLVSCICGVMIDKTRLWLVRRRRA